MQPHNTDSQPHWFAMRDLKRANAKQPAYRQLADRHIEVFTPMKWCLHLINGKKVREQIPFVQDLLFVHETRDKLDPIVNNTPTLQYRYRRHAYLCPMTVSDKDMRNFILAVKSSDSPQYYLPKEITPAMYGSKIRIVGGILNGCEGHLITTRGSKIKRLLVELHDILFVSVEVSPEFIQIITSE